MKTRIKPFREFWLNCEFNFKMSILCTIEPSYRYFAYLNNYTYSFNKAKEMYKDEATVLNLGLVLSEEHENILNSIEYIPIQFKYEKNYLDKLKVYLENNIVAVMVDLFYWLPNSVFWNTLHQFHLTLINGYDDERKVLFALDDDYSGYAEHEIPYDRAEKAILSEFENHNEDGYIINVLFQLESYSLSMEEVYYNSRRLVKELKELKKKVPWGLDSGGMDEVKWLEIMRFNISTIVNRQLANDILFNVLSEKELINKCAFEQLKVFCEHLNSGWNVVKGMTLKSLCLKKNIKKREINERIGKLFSQEMIMWEYLGDSLKRRKHIEEA